MDKNLILAILLSTVFLGVWYKFFMPTTPKSAPIVAEQKAGDSLSPSQVVAQKANGMNASVQAPSTERILETDFEKIVIDSRGAAIKHWWVKEKTQSGVIKPEKDWPDLVNHAHYGDEGLSAEDWGLSTFPDISFRQVLGVSKTESIWLATLPSGLELEKKFSVLSAPGGAENGGSAPLIKLSLTLRNTAKKTVPLDSIRLAWGPGLGTVQSEQKENEGVTRVLAYPSATKEVEKFKEGAYPYSYSWAAIDNRYYLLAMLPKQGHFGQVIVEKSKENPGVVTLASTPGELEAGKPNLWEVDIYGGPKGYTQLKKMGFGLEHSVDFGFFGFLGKWALKALYSLRRATGNFGWAIILLTIALQVIVLPLTIKSYQSTLAMKNIQPKIQELQKRYNCDAMRLILEMMKLYK